MGLCAVISTVVLLNCFGQRLQINRELSDLKAERTKLLAKNAALLLLNNNKNDDHHEEKEILRKLIDFMNRILDNIILKTTIKSETTLTLPDY